MVDPKIGRTDIGLSSACRRGASYSCRIGSRHPFTLRSLRDGPSLSHGGDPRPNVPAREVFARLRAYRVKLPEIEQA
jgi:hypothetical protein